MTLGALAFGDGAGLAFGAGADLAGVDLAAAATAFAPFFAPFGTFLPFVGLALLSRLKAPAATLSALWPSYTQYTTGCQCRQMEVVI